MQFAEDEAEPQAEAAEGDGHDAPPAAERPLADMPLAGPAESETETPAETLPPASD